MFIKGAIFQALMSSSPRITWAGRYLGMYLRSRCILSYFYLVFLFSRLDGHIKAARTLIAASQHNARQLYLTKLWRCLTNNRRQLSDRKIVTTVHVLAGHEYPSI